MRNTSNAVSVFAVKAVANKDLVLHGDGSQVRSWCYIADFCEGVLAAAEKPAGAGQDFNIGNPVTASTIYDLAQRIIRLSGSRSRLVTTAHTFSDIGVRAPNMQKARELLSYHPTHDLDAGLTPTIEWFRQHADKFTHWLK
jgi:dTDP-glucose 4,6-dehydratase